MAITARPVCRIAATSSPASAAAWAVIGFASAVAMTLSVAGTALAQPLAIIGRIPRTQIRILHPFPSSALPLEALHFRRLTGIPPASIPNRPQGRAERQNSAQRPEGTFPDQQADHTDRLSARVTA